MQQNGIYTHTTVLPQLKIQHSCSPNTPFHTPTNSPSPAVAINTAEMWELVGCYVTGSLTTYLQLNCCDHLQKIVLIPPSPQTHCLTLTATPQPQPQKLQCMDRWCVLLSLVSFTPMHHMFHYLICQLNYCSQMNWIIVHQPMYAQQNITALPWPHMKYRSGWQ